MRRKSCGVAATLLGAVCWIGACGGSGGGLSDSTADGVAGGTGGTLLDLGNAVAEVFDGGTVVLTAEQVDTVLSSACVGSVTQGEIVPSVIQLVVDVSGSMTAPAPGSAETKWDETLAALLRALDQLGPDMPVGLLLYPNQATPEDFTSHPVDECVAIDQLVEIERLGATGADHRLAIETSLREANVRSGTPTQDAFTYALENSLIPYSSLLDKYMLLITDGEPTYAVQCNGDGYEPVAPEPILDVIAGAHEQAVRTFVIGSPGSESARNWLSTAASVGGTGAPGCEVDSTCHLDMTEVSDFGAALQEALRQILGTIGQCRYAIPEPPEGETLDRNEVSVLIHSGGETRLVLPDRLGDCTEGWQFDEEGNVVLCEATCERTSGGFEGSIELLFGCSTEEVIEIY